MAQANWRQPLQDFQAWISRGRVRQDELTAGLQDFIPAGEVAAYLHHPGRLQGILDALFGDCGGNIVPRQLWAHYSVVFAILVSIDHGEYIGNFVSHDSLCDARLPFTERPTRFPLDQGARDVFFKRFSAAQARFCAPKLREGHHKFEWDERLPFLEKIYIDDGGSAKVYRVKLHAEHDQLHRPESSPESPKSHRMYALKAYYGGEGERWHSIETATFRKLKQTGLDTAHMIGYHCSFEHRNVRYALLEYADRHTLENFMMDENSIPPSTDEEILSFWENLLCVIVAVREIHDLDSHGDDTPEPGKFTGVHQDIKPKNILVKSKEHATSIYDSSFGLADLGTSSMVRATSHLAARDNYGTKTYGSPECFRKDSVDDNRDIKITSKADIWSFGCVLSEVCIWVIFGSNGPHGLKSYRQRRQDHNIGVARGADCFHLNGQASQAVLDEHKKAAAQGRCDSVTRAILELMPKMLHSVPKRRPSAQELRSHFVDIMDQAKAGALDTTRSIHKSTRTVSTSTMQSSASSSPLEPRRVRPGTISTGQPLVGPALSSPIFERARQTETPRAYTFDIDSHDHSNSAVADATTALEEQLAHTTDRLNADAPRSDRIATHRLVRETLESAGVAENDNPQPGHHNESRRQPDTNHPPVAKPTQMTSNPRPSAVVNTFPTSHGHLPRPSDSNSRTPPVKLDFELASKWRREWRNGVKLPDENLFHQLAERDHVFVIDDCKSMGDMRAACKAKRAKEVADYVDVLSYMVKRHDPDGVDLRYLNSADVIKRCKSSSRLEGSVRGTAFAGLSNPERTLNGLLRPYLAKVRAYEAELRAFNNRGRASVFSFTGPPKLPTPLSIYVLTDGVWESPGTPGGGYLEDTLKDLIKGLRAAGCRRGQIGIQFIRFGSHEYGVQRLEALDHLGTKDDMDLDIVDTEPVENGNVWKMLLGAINSRFDAD